MSRGDYGPRDLSGPVMDFGDYGDVGRLGTGVDTASTPRNVNSSLFSVRQVVGMVLEGRIKRSCRVACEEVLECKIVDT